MAFDLALGPNRVQKSGNCLLQYFKTNRQYVGAENLYEGVGMMDATRSVWATD